MICGLRLKTKNILFKPNPVLVCPAPAVKAVMTELYELVSIGTPSLTGKRYLLVAGFRVYGLGFRSS